MAQSAYIRHLRGAMYAIPNRLIVEFDDELDCICMSDDSDERLNGFIDAERKYKEFKL
jgi:hypothetical protein